MSSLNRKAEARTEFTSSMSLTYWFVGAGSSNIKISSDGPTSYADMDESWRAQKRKNKEEGKETIKKLLQKHRWAMEGNCDVLTIQFHGLLCKTLI